MKTIKETGMTIEEIESFIKRFVFNPDDLETIRWETEIIKDSINIRPKKGNSLHCIQAISQIVYVLKLSCYASVDNKGIYICIF